MYVTEQQKVWKLTDLNNDGIYEVRTLFIDSLGTKAAQPVGGHVTRSLAFDFVNNKGEVFMNSGGGYAFILQIYPIVSPVGLNPIPEIPEIKIFPNPANHVISVQANEFSGKNV